jgi:hypothetical protein
MTESNVIDFQSDTWRVLYACGTVRYTLRNFHMDQSQQAPISIVGVTGITHKCATPTMQRQAGNKAVDSYAHAVPSSRNSSILISIILSVCFV